MAEERIAAPEPPDASDATDPEAGRGSRPDPGGAGPRVADAAEGDPLSAMTPRFNLFFRAFARRFFRHIDLEPEGVARLHGLERRGAVVYVMRYSSRLDYFLFNALFRREGLRLSRFANGIRFYYYRPFAKAVGALVRALRRRRGEPRSERSRRLVRHLTEEGESFFLFLRTARQGLFSRSRRPDPEATELDLLEEVVRAAWRSDRPVHLVPLALFWRKGPRAERRFLNLSYGAATRPSDLAKVTSFLTTYRGLFVKVGDPIDLGGFIEERRHEGEGAIARKVRRSILTFLYREEKVVEGPTLRPRHKVQEVVLSHPLVQGAIRNRAREKNVSLMRARADAEKNFREIAAHMNSTFLAVLDLLVSWVMRRLFASIEVSGIEKVADYAKRHPLVLVPSHRSYFDFIIISQQFYSRHLVPPHIAARENMAFGPFGFLWRRCGAFFLRRDFDDPLYKEVFRSYVGYLVREGFTQEFFIEGARSRTGKTLTPRLGMLAWDVEAFLASARRDLFFVPIAITYERLVEEGAMVDELRGSAKQEESMLGLVRARKFLQRRFGSVYVNFGEPVSLAAAMGERRERFAQEPDPEVIREKRSFVDGLAHRIVERINWAVVPNATSVAACALLGEAHRGVLRQDLVRRMQLVVDLLRLQDLRLTPELLADEGEFRESIASLLRSDHIRSVDDGRGEILYFDESKRLALEIYRNQVCHFLAAPSLLARLLLAGPPPGGLRQALSFWLEIFYSEFFVPRGEVLAAQLDGFLDHFERMEWIERNDEAPRVTEKGRPTVCFLAEQTRGIAEAWHAAFAAAATVAPDEVQGRKALVRTAQEQFERAELLGEVARREAANAVTFGNAFDLLARRGILAPAKSGASREPGYARGEAFDDLPALRERLAALLACR